MRIPDLRSLVKRYLFDAEILRLMALVILIKPLGMMTQVLRANYFGAGPENDAYALTTFVVVFIGTIFGQVFTSIAIPYVIKLRDGMDRTQLMGFQTALIVGFILPTVLLTVLLMVNAGGVVDLAGPGLPVETRAYAVRMVRYLALPGVMMLLIPMGNAILNLNRKYRLPASMPIINSATMLLVLILLHGRLGIWSLVVGFAASQLLQTLIVWTRAFQCGHVALARPYLPEGAIRRLWSLSWALMLTQAILLLYRFIDKMFASSLETGSISALSYALTIKTLGVQLFQMTLVTIMFTRLAEFIGAGEYRECGRYLKDNIGRVSRIVAPATLILCLASGEIVRILFMRGAFSAADAERTTGVMILYAMGLPAFIINLIAARVFHSLQRMKEKIWLGLQYLVMNVALNALLVGPMKVQGLALGTTLTIYCHLLLSFWVLHRYRLGLGVVGWTVVMLRNLSFAAAAYAIYAVSGLDSVLSSCFQAGRIPGDLLMILVKTVYVMVVYGGLYLAWRAWSRRDGAPGSGAAR